MTEIPLLCRIYIYISLSGFYDIFLTTAANTLVAVMKSEPTINKIKNKASIFKCKKIDSDSPPQVYNWRLYYCIFIFGIVGCARGADEGLTSITALPAFISKFGLEDSSKSADEKANLVSNIKSMVQLGSILGAIIASFLVDKLGRVRSLQFICIFWIVGAIIQITASSVGQLYAGRFIEGALAVGITATTGPTYLSEVTPKAVRGTASSVFAGSVYLGVMLGYFSTYGSAIHISDTLDHQWRTPLTLKVILGGSILIGSCFTIESPRWLMKAGKEREATASLSKLRNLSPDDPYTTSEIADITDSIYYEQQESKGNNLWTSLISLFTKKSLIYRFFILGFLCQVLGQWSGANSITIYASDLFELSGIKGIQILKMTAVLGVVKFISAYLAAFFCIDLLGRRKSIYIGITIQMITLLYFAIFLKVAPLTTGGNTEVSESQHRAAQGAIAAIFLAGVGWTIGFNSLLYLIGAEIFPLGLRTFAQSLLMVIHFTNQYGNSKAVPEMLLALQGYGTFFFFVGVNAISLLWAWYFVPETSGRSLESMEELFNLPWHIIGRGGHISLPDVSHHMSKPEGFHEAP